MIIDEQQSILCDNMCPLVLELYSNDAFTITMMPITYTAASVSLIFINLIITIGHHYFSLSLISFICHCFITYTVLYNTYNTYISSCHLLHIYHIVE